MIDEEALELLSNKILEIVLTPMRDIVKDEVHVWSGRQQKTVDFEIKDGRGSLKIGSDEELWNKIVNYVIIEEYRHPQIRNHAIPLIFSLFRAGVLLQYKRKTQDATSPLR